MYKLGFFHIAVRNHKATKFVVDSVRQHHANESYVLFSDAGENYDYLSDQYKLTCIKDNIKTGPPRGAHGYSLPKILEFFSRFKTACEVSEAQYLVMLEDDVLVRKQITVPDNCIFTAHSQGDGTGNVIHQYACDKIQQFSGKTIKVPVYACGGGSIFNTSVFLDNYQRIIDFYIRETDNIQQVYPTWGWIDCFMHVYFLLAGADYLENINLTDTHNHRPGFDYQRFLGNLSDNIQIVNNYKKYYYE